jgi:hypothetical protein
LYPSTFFLFLSFGTGFFIPSVAVTVVVAILYTILRFFLHGSFIKTLILKN